LVEWLQQRRLLFLYSTLLQLV